MDRRVAVSAAAKESLLEGMLIAPSGRSERGGHGAAQVSRVTLQTEGRLRQSEERIAGRTVRAMAIDAVFVEVGVFVDKRALVLHVAAGTGFLHRASVEEIVLHRPMRIVTVDAGDFVFRYAVVGKLLIFVTYVDMAPETESRHVAGTDFLLRSLMELVAVEATDIACGMRTGIPMLKICRGHC